MPDPNLHRYPPEYTAALPTYGRAPQAALPKAAPGIRQRLVLRWISIPGNVRGGLWALLATGCFALMLALIKLVGESLHVTQILLFRQSLLLLIALPAIIAGFPGSLKTKRLDLQAARIAFAFLSMTLGFSAFIHLPLAEATTLAFSKNFFLAILAIVFLGEIVGPRRWTALAIGFAGVVLVAWPTEGEFVSIYALAALGSAMSLAIVLVLIRKLTKVDQPVTIMAFQSTGVGILMIIPAIYFWQTPTTYELGLLLAIGLVSAAAQYLNILTLRAAEASAVAPIDYLRIVFAAILGYYIFSEVPDIRVVIGAVVIIGAAFYTVTRERAAAVANKAQAPSAIPPSQHGRTPAHTPYPQSSPGPFHGQR